MVELREIILQVAHKDIVRDGKDQNGSVAPAGDI